MRCSLIPDRLAKYHAYTVAYRAAGSTRYADFHPHDPRDLTSIADFAASLNFSGDRAELSSTLLEHARRMDAPPESLANIEALADADTVAVVAGHQPALFGGPLFILLKTLSILRLAALLNESDSTHRYVPLFWNASEEHNQAEFARLSVFDNEHDLARLTLDLEPAPRMAAATAVDAAAGLLDELSAVLPDTDFLSPLAHDLRAAMRNDLGETFSRLLLRQLGAFGLVVLEPRFVRELAAPVIRRALAENVPCRECLAADTAAMQNMGYSPPLPVDEAARTLVFYLQEGCRYRIRREDDSLVLEDARQRFGKRELLDMVEAHPERFSPAAALRPIVQAAILPVCVYVAGGGELAYHLQLRKLFAHCRQTMPLLLPRAAATLMKSSGEKVLARLSIDPMRLLSENWDWETVEKEALAHVAEQADAFATFRERLKRAEADLEEDLRETGVSNFNELARERQRFLDRIERVEQQFKQKNPAVGEGPKRQYHRLRKLILPGGGYQELASWTVYFQALYGADLAARLLPHIDPLTPMHHLLRMD